jgi:hypothetical protein
MVDHIVKVFMKYVVPSLLPLKYTFSSAVLLLIIYEYLQVALRIDYMSMCMLVATRTHEYL